MHLARVHQELTAVSGNGEREMIGDRLVQVVSHRPAKGRRQIGALFAVGAPDSVSMRLRLHGAHASLKPTTPLISRNSAIPNPAYSRPLPDCL
jgi:hypothetical protein